MRAINFRDGVLWNLAERIGLDPLVSFLTDQGQALAFYINAWVRRLWDAADWPEWSILAPFAPTNHIVPFNDPGTPANIIIGRALKLYLVDPATTNDPVDYPFSLLSDGVHVGFEHGTNVWIKYLPPCPQFSATAWDPGRTYNLGELTYSPTTGESYVSLIYNNVGNDPAGVGQPPPGGKKPLLVEVTQKFQPGQSGLPAVNQKWSFNVTFNNWWSLASYTYSINLVDGENNSHQFVYITNPLGGGTVDDVLSGLIAAAAGSSDPWVAALTVTKDTPNGLLFVEKGEVFVNALYSNASQVADAIDGDPMAFLPAVDLQKFFPGSDGSPATPQLTTVNLSTTPFAQIALYEVTVFDYTGTPQTASYQSVITDTPASILGAIVARMTGGVFDRIAVTSDPTTMILNIQSQEGLTIDADFLPQPSPTPWQIVPFPFALADQVVRGAMADYYKEAGQSDKGAQEEQAVPQETATRAESFTSKEFDQLTDQQKPKSRYSVK